MEKENRLEVIGKIDGCAGKSCPTIYKDSTGKIFIQGYRIDSNLKSQITVANNEDVIELAPELLEALKAI